MLINMQTTKLTFMYLFVLFDTGEYEIAKTLIDENCLILAFGTSLSLVQSNKDIKPEQILTLDQLGIKTMIDRTWDRQMPLSNEDLSTFKKEWLL